MKILQLLPKDFGKFHLEEPLNLVPGLNIIVGGNERGKSTLHAFILGMLYGFKDEGRLRVVRTDHFEKYRPWQGRDYAGVMVYEHEDRLYRIERSFDPDETKIFDGVTGEEISTRFSLDNRKEYDFARRHLGLGMKEFVNTIWIGQLGSQQEPGLGQHVRSKIADLVQTGDDFPLAETLSILERERQRLKNSGYTRAELDILRHEISRLEGEATQALIREEEMRDLLREASILQEEKAEAEERAAVLEKEVLCLRYRLLKQTLDEVSSLSAALDELQERAKALQWARTVDEASQKTLIAVDLEIDKLRAEKKELESRVKILENRAAEIRSELDCLGSLPDAGVTEAEIVSKYQAYSRAQTELSRLARLLKEAQDAVARLESEGRIAGYLRLEAMDDDFVENARYIATQVETVEFQSKTAAIEVERVRAQVEAINPWRAAAWLYSLAMALGVVAGTAFLHGQNWWWLGAGAAVLCLGIGVYQHVVSSKAKARKVALLRRKEEEALAMTTRAGEARRALKGFLSEAQVGSIEELLRLRNDLSSWRDRRKAAQTHLEKVLELVSEASRDYERARNDLAVLTRWPAHPRAGADRFPVSGEQLMPVSAAEGDPARDARVEVGQDLGEESFEALKADIRRAGELKRELADCEESQREASEKLFAVAAKLSEFEMAREDLLKSENVTSAEELDVKVKSARELREVERKIEEIRSKMAALLEGQSLDGLRRKVEEIEPRVDVSLISSDVVRREDLDATMDRLSKERESASRLAAALSRIEEALALRFKEGRPLYEIEEELRAKRIRAGALARDAEALWLAHETLLEVSKTMQREFVPVLAKRTGDILAVITGSRYSEVKISPDLEVTVIMPDTARAARVDSLSMGTIDQGYFALRIALAELLSGRKDFPLFLDDSFVQYDDERLSGALKIIESLISAHQVVLFSHESRITAMLDSVDTKANIVRLEDVEVGRLGRQSSP